MVTITDPNYYVLAAEQNSYLCPEGSEISAADNYIAFQDNITSCPEGEKMSLCLCGCGQECKEGRLYKNGHNRRGKRLSEKHKEILRLSLLERPVSEETRENLRLANLGENNPQWGKHHTKEWKENARLRNLGKNNPFYGKGPSKEAREKAKLACLGNKFALGYQHSDEAKEKMRQAKLGKRLAEKHKEKLRIIKSGKYNPFYGKHHSQESLQKMSGENSPQWKGGISFLPYCPKFNERLKERVRERDGRKCQLCERTELENGRKLTVHHVHYDKENCYPDLLALCFRCNSAVNSNRDYWEKRCMEILEKRGLLNWKPVNVLEKIMNARLGG